MAVLAVAVPMWRTVERVVPEYLDVLDLVSLSFVCSRTYGVSS